MARIETVEKTYGKMDVAAFDSVYDVDGRVYGKVTKNGYTTIWSGFRTDDPNVMAYIRVITIKD